MIEIKANFEGGLNLDDSEYAIAPNSYADALNITRNAVSGSKDRVITNIVGNRKIPYTYPSGVGKVIGSYSFQLRNTVIFFRWNSNGFHGVYEGNLTTRVITKIFESKTDSAGIDILNFTENDKITGIDILPRDEDGDLLFFLDSLGRPSEMDIALFKAGEYTPVTRELIDKGKFQPLAPVSSVYDNDTSIRSNNLRNKLFRFSYRWVYDDFEKSTFSPISIVPLPISVLDDTYTNVITNNNVIRLVANNGGKNVKAIELGMSYVDKTNDWSDFLSIALVNKVGSTLTQTSVISEDGGGTTQIYVAFAGKVSVGDVVNIYINQLPGTEKLVAVYTSTGYSIDNLIQGVLKSLSDIGIVATEQAFENGLVFTFPTATYEFERVDIISSETVLDNIDFSYSFYNDSTYPVITKVENIEPFFYVPDKALAQCMPNGNTVAYGAISEGYNKDTVEDVIITVLTVAAGSGGVVGNLIATVTHNGTESAFPLPGLLQVMNYTFSGIPATGTIINVTVRRKSDHTNIIATTYTTIAGDTSDSVSMHIAANNTAPFVETRYLGTSIMSFRILQASYEPVPANSLYSLMTITAPTTGVSTNSIPTWEFSTARSIARQYFDRQGKTNGILYADKVTFPAYNENGGGQVLLPYINYKINDIPPIWAWSVEFYFNKDDSTYIVWESLSVNKAETEYIYFDVTSFVSNAIKKPATAKVLSYSFKDGDRVRIWRSITGIVLGDTYDAAVEGLVVDPIINGVASTGTFLKIKNIEPFTTGLDDTTNYVLFIYSPTQQTANSENQVYYGIGREYPIIDATLTTRRHAGEVADQIVGVTPAEYNFYDGDSYFRSRTVASDIGYQTFNVIDKNFVDFYISAVSSIDGRPSFIDTNAKRQYFGGLIRFSKTYQSDTNINGLNQFYELNYIDADIGFGDITRMKVRQNATKIFQKFKIGISPTYNELSRDSNNKSILIVTDKLFNRIQYRIGNLGLTSPESLASWHFADYGCDTNKGIIWRDSNDGVEPISELYKVDSWATVELPIRKGDFKIYGAIDPKKNEYIAALEEYITPVPFFYILATETTSIGGTALALRSTASFTIDWGDGTIDIFAAGVWTPTHVYITPYSGYIKVIADDLSTIYVLGVGDDAGGVMPAQSLTLFSSEVKKLTALTILSLGTDVFLDGLVSDLPPILQSFGTEYTNLSGTTIQLPRTLVNIAITGSSTITGNISNLPSTSVIVFIRGLNTISGNLSQVPRSVTSLGIDGNNTLSGDVVDLPSGLQLLEVFGNNTISGNISGFNSGMVFIVVFGFNKLSGNISSFNAGLKTTNIAGLNTITGTISSIPIGAESFQISGANTISGNVANTPNNVTFLRIHSLVSTVNAYSSGVKTWKPVMNCIDITPGAGGLSSTDVDNLLIELAAQVTSWTGVERVVIIQGGSSPRTAASNAAVATITSRGATVITN